MATLSEVMRYALDLDVDGFLSGLRKAERGADDTFESISDAGDDTAGRFDGLGGKMGKALVAGFAAVGAGALIMQGINQAMDAEQGVRRLQGQFDLTAQEAKRYGDLAGELYRDGWGSGLTEVQQAFALASRDLEVTNDETLSRITEGVLATSSTFGVEFSDVIRAVSQLLENGLAPDAESALDVVVRAFQNGGDQAGDLLDTIIEYSQHWAAVGLDGEAALSQVVNGLQNGQRDADKMADAVKEMRIRIVENSDDVREALSNIGVDADRVVESFLEGGPAARDAFTEVVEALRSGQLQGDDTSDAVAILGTQFEDLGPKALQSLLAIEGQLGQVEGATERLSDTVEATEWDKFKREGERALTTIGGAALSTVNPLLESINDQVDILTSGFGLWGDSAEDAADRATGAMEGAESATWELTDAQREQWRASIEQTEAAEAAERQALLNSEAMRDQARAADRTATVLGGLERGTDDLADATGDLTDEVSEADRAYQRFLGRLSDREAFRSAQDSVATYVERLHEANRAHEAGELSADELRETTSRAFDRMAADVVKYVGQLDGIPDQAKTEFLAVVREGDVARIEAELAELTRRREIILEYRTTGSASVPITPGSTSGIRHVGGPVSAGQAYQTLPGEVFVPNTSGQVLSRERAREVAGGAGIVVNMTINGGTADPRAIGAEVERRFRAIERDLRAGRRIR